MPEDKKSCGAAAIFNVNSEDVEIQDTNQVVLKTQLHINCTHRRRYITVTACDSAFINCLTAAPVLVCYE